MAKAKNTQSKISKFKEIIKSESFKYAIGIILLLFSVYCLFVFFSFFSNGPKDFSKINGVENSIEQVSNSGGTEGAKLASLLINDGFGVASIFLIFLLAVISLRIINIRRINLSKWFISCTILTFWFSLLLGSFNVDTLFFYLGGKHGKLLSEWIIFKVGYIGFYMLLLAILICFCIYIFKSTNVIIKKVFSFSYSKRNSETNDVLQNDNIIKDSESNDVKNERIKDNEDVDENLNEGRAYMEEALPVVNDNVLPTKNNNDLELSIDEENGIIQEEAITSTILESNENTPEMEIEVVPDETEEDIQINTFDISKPYDPRRDLELYKFPTLDLLNKYENAEPSINMEEQNANKNNIIKVLKSFGIEICSIRATVGPTITLYEITPQQGIRISKIRGLEDDIALSLKALGIRIIAPIPGKGTIGIEVPNSEPKIVSMQSIIASKKFQEANYDLPIAFGKTITNDVFMVDLAKMPHILVAGATGQGKSVGLNAIITSLLYKKHPSELKFVMIDPKKVEFSIYSIIEKHFLAKLPDADDAIITDFTKVIHTLNSLCIEMDSRYDLLKLAHVRNIKEYNQKFISRQLNPEKGHKYMPYIVVVIDEFGDLIMTAGKDIELPIARIAQLARAVGIHMIIATQRPTTQIITGTIKANFPARVAFKVSQMIDSRTILDRPGANQLIGKGDMLFLQGNEPVRVQCAFVDTEEVENITHYIASQQGYSTAFLLPEYSGDNNDKDVSDFDVNKLDSMFEEAARLIVIHQQGSTSLIQRKFSIGYNRAGRIMDQLEHAGIVGPSEGSKPRQVLCVDEIDLQNKLSIIKNRI